MLWLEIPTMGTDVPTPDTAATLRRDDSSTSALADAIFTSTQQRVLALLFGEHEREFFVTEIIALAGSGRCAVQRELSRLAGSGLAVVSRLGSLENYRANRESPLFEEICSIVCKTIGPEESFWGGREPLVDKLILALPFRSVARRKDTAAGDIDLLLVSDDLTLEAIYTAMGPVEDQLGRRVNPTLYTSNEFRMRRKAKAGFLTLILQGPHMVLEGSLNGE